MLDGSTSMDPGVNRPATRVSVEAIQEVRVATSAYQAEYGRASGLQVNAVTKSGTNRFVGSIYDVERSSKWNANSKTNILNGDPKPFQDERDYGFAIGGPVGKPGGTNKLFFYLHDGDAAAHRGRRRHPLPDADLARTPGRFLEVDEQPRPAVSVHQGSAARPAPAMPRARSRVSTTAACLARFLRARSTRRAWPS